MLMSYYRPSYAVYVRIILYPSWLLNKNCNSSLNYHSYKRIPSSNATILNNYASNKASLSFTRFTNSLVKKYSCVCDLYRTFNSHISSLTILLINFYFKFYKRPSNYFNLLNWLLLLTKYLNSL